MSANYIITSSGAFASEEELYHYGVLGMKLGQRKVNRLSAANERYLKKALKFDAKSAKLYKKAEKQHSENDLGISNKAATKAANYLKKAAKIRKKSLPKDDNGKLRAEKKAFKLEYKAAKKQAKADRLSKSTGYGLKAMRLSIKSDKVKIKAAKMRSKIASNKAYSSIMKQRMDSLDREKLRKVQEPLSSYIKESFHKE